MSEHLLRNSRVTITNPRSSFVEESFLGRSDSREVGIEIDRWIQFLAKLARHLSFCHFLLQISLVRHLVGFEQGCPAMF